MLLTTHTLIGGAIGQAAGNAPLGFVLAFASHFALDAIPHFDPGIWHKEKKNYDWDAREWTIIILDIIAMVVLLTLLLPHSIKAPFIAGAIGGALLDIITNIPWWQKTIKKIAVGAWLSNLHNKIHYDKSTFIKNHKWTALAIQIIVVGLIFWLIGVK